MTPTNDAPVTDDDGPCTDCRDTGMTIQTERPCSCDAGDQYRAKGDAPVTVEQCDRDDCADFELMVGRINPGDASRIRNGDWDATKDVLWFVERRHRLAALASAPAEPKSKRDTAIAALRDYMTSAGVPLTEFDPEFAVRMMGAMMVSFHKYGRVADAYPVKFDARSDVRARMRKYQETGNKHYLVDAANFAMIEAMHPARPDATWGENSAADSPGRTTADGHRLVQEANDGSRIMGETILHNPGDHA